MKFSVHPQGLSLGQGSFRPAMIFKDKQEREVLPVWLDQMEASVLLASSQAGVRTHSAHSVSFKLFSALNIDLKSVYFDEVSANTQYATLTAVQGKKEVSVRVRASEAMSIALNARCTFFTNQDVIEKSRALTYEFLLHMEHGHNGHSRDNDFMH